jgi:hypothetical protein
MAPMSGDRRDRRDRGRRQPLPVRVRKIAALALVLGALALAAGLNEVRLGHEKPPKGGSVYVPPWTNYAVALGSGLFALGVAVLGISWLTTPRRSD